MQKIAHFGLFPLTEVMSMTEDYGTTPTTPQAPRTPQAPLQAPPPRSGGGMKMLFIALIVAVVVAVGVLFLVPLILGSNPIDVLRGRGATEVQEIKTVEERVVKAGQEAVVEVASRVLPSVVNIEVQFGNLGSGIGSGFIYSADGYIVTNNHVVAGATLIRVSLRDGSSFEATAVGLDPETDIAIIKIGASDLPAATLGTSSDLVQGELAVAMGSPEGFEGSVTSGVISALNRNIYIGGSPPLLDVIQTDAAINPGNSGGPLCNSVGEVVGINTAIYSQSGGYDGLGFAIAIDNAKPIIEQLIETGSVVHPWLGISGSTLDPDTARSYDLPVESGAIVNRVVAGAPAEKAGLERGDIIVAMGGTPIDSMDRLVLEIRNRDVGDTVSISYFRDGEKRETTAVLEEKPATVIE
ncbi:MAG: trypsin-like peptidase domain-containing protein [Actinomycetota bacterium]|nr:trypsin-like peptidase domain-containing protein [Actinomycetota bacterium]MDD5667303.1 trypsin-like peptidase domain-containing protein [Actinomycetota bacterium]